LPEFATLTDAEIAAMEAVVRDGLAIPSDPTRGPTGWAC